MKRPDDMKKDYIIVDGKKWIPAPEQDEPCLWDSMPETTPGSGVKIGWLSCPCPKCSPRC